MKKNNHLSLPSKLQGSSQQQILNICTKTMSNVKTQCEVPMLKVVATFQYYTCLQQNRYTTAVYVHRYLVSVLPM